MENLNYNGVLKERLNSYFTDDEMSRFGITEDVVNTLIQNVDCDYDKLVSALDELIARKNLNDDSIFQHDGNVFDVSKNSPVTVKGFLTERHNRLHFYKDNEIIPFFKIKLDNAGSEKKITINTTNNPRVFANNNNTIIKREDIDGLCHVFNAEYNYDKDCVIRETARFEKSGVRQNEEPAVELNKLRSDYYEFYDLINRCVKVKLPENLTGPECNVVFSSFYDVLGEVLNYESEFEIKDLIKIVNKFVALNPKFAKNNSVNTTDLSSASDKIWDCKEINCYDRNNKPIKLLVNNVMGESVIINAVNENGVETCSYNILKTGDGGISICRKVYDKSFDGVDFYTFGFSKDQLNFIAKDDSHTDSNRIEDKTLSLSERYRSKNHSPIKMQLSFWKNGEMVLNKETSEIFEIEKDSLAIEHSDEKLQMT